MNRVALADVHDVLGAFFVRQDLADPADPLDDPEVQRVDVDGWNQPPEEFSISQISTSPIEGLARTLV